MTDLTETQLARLRRKIGDTNTPPVFTDEELQDLWTEAGEDWNTTIRDAYDELLSSAWKFTDYTQNESVEKKRQIFENLQKMVARYDKKIEDASKSRNQIRMAGLKTIPPKQRDKP